MQDNSEKHRLQWQRLAEDFVDDLLSLTDTDLEAEIEADGTDFHSAADEVRSDIQALLLSRRRERMSQARFEMQGSRRRDESEPLHVNSEKRDSIRDALLEGDSGLLNGLTIAARNGAELSEEDLDEVIRALFDLGKIDEQGNLL